MRPARRRWLPFVLLGSLVACQSTPALTPTVPPATATPLPYLKTPYLLEPPDESHWQTVQIKLSWRWPTELGADEYFDVLIWREDQPHFGVAWTRNLTYQIDDVVRRGGPGLYYWSIAVIRGHEGKLDAELSQAAPAWTFVVDALPTPTPASAGLKLVPGFTATDYAQVSLPTAMAWGPDGALYVSEQGGAIRRLRDTNGDQVVDETTLVADGFNTPLGLAFRGKTLYVSSAHVITTLRDTNGDGKADNRQDIITGLPAQEYDSHQNNGIAFGPDGRLYIAVGASSDHGPVTEPLEASILVANPDGSDLKVYATGLRNPYSLVFAPDGTLFSPDNAPDTPDQRLPYIPAEELNVIVEGGKYGFPDFFNIPPADSGIQAPILLFTTGSVPTGMAMYEANLLPASYRGNLFVALWGEGMIRARNGHKVVRIVVNQAASGWKAEMHDFLDTDDRPIAVAVGPDGALYVAQYLDGVIFRIVPR